MTDTYYREPIGEIDIQFGVDTFLRLNDEGGYDEITKVNKTHIPRKIEQKTSNYTITTTIDYGEFIFTNEGATGTITITLPVAKSGIGPFLFLVADAQQLRIDPNGNEYFRDCAAGKYKYSSVQGNRLTVWCDVDGIWEYDYDLVSGNWDNEE